MATFRIFEDQENRVHNPVGRAKEKPAQNKRTILGVLQSNRTQINEITKDEKQQVKTSKSVAQNGVEFSIYEENLREPALKSYENKLIKETSVALRETEKENATKDKEINNCSKSSARTVLQEINLTVLEQSKPLVNNKTDCQSTVQSEDFHSQTFKFDRSVLTELKSKKEPVKPRSDLFDVDVYRDDIYNYLRQAEKQHRPKPGYMKKQPDITYSMRSILIEWLVEVAEEYRLENETLYLAVSYIDRFLSYMSVVRAKLQLVGTAAMFIAAKYEEIYPPEVGEFVFITDDTYSKKQVLRMEHLILRVLSFDLTVPTPLTFLLHYCTHNNLPNRIKYLAMYLCELSMLEADPYLEYLPSMLAASAIALAQHTMLEEVWPHELELSSGYSLRDLKECVSNLTKTFEAAANNKQQAIYEKYKASKYDNVALLTPRNTEIYDEDSEA